MAISEKTMSNNRFISFSSIVSVIGLQEKNGISSRVERGLMKSPSKGCGYSVLIVDGTREEALRVLKENRIIENDES